MIKTTLKCIHVLHEENLSRPQLSAIEISQFINPTSILASTLMLQNFQVFDFLQLGGKPSKYNYKM